MTPHVDGPVSLSPSGEPRQDLAGTVKPYGRHLIVCTGRVGWPSHVDEDAGLCQSLAEAVADAPTRVKVTACDLGDPGDVLAFPDAMRYRGVRDASDLTGGEPLSGTWIFVCVHAGRDVRCGKCGPPVVRRFREEIASRGLEGVTIARSSHVGQHVLAANVLVYPSGDWYGYVTPDDVGRLLDAALSGSVVDDLHRGRMSAPD